MSKTVDNIAWSNQKLQIRWRRINNPQVQGIATVFEGRVFNPNLYFDTRGAKEYLYVLVAELSIQPHLVINYLRQSDQQHNNMIVLIAVVTVAIVTVASVMILQQV